LWVVKIISHLLWLAGCFVKFAVSAVVCVAECGGDTEGDYNDVQLLDTSSDTLNGVLSVTDSAMNSSTAIADNLMNVQRQLNRFRYAPELKYKK